MTPAQLQTFKTAILADANLTDLVATGQTGAIAQYYQADSTFTVWKSSTSSADIIDAVTWSNYTPADAPDSTTLYLNRCEICAIKRDNMRAMLASERLLTGKNSTRVNLQDALQNVPAGAGGALLDAGWLGAGKVKATISRLANKLEALFATGTGTASVPGNLVVEHVPGISDVDKALAS